MDKVGLALIISSSISGLAIGGTVVGYGSKYIKEVVSEKNQFNDINEALCESYNGFEVSVQTIKDKYNLTSKYTIVNDKDSYSVFYTLQHYAKPDLETGIFPENLIETETGKKTQAGNINLKKYKISNDDFNNFNLSKTFFSGELANGKEFMHSESDLLNFTFNVRFSDKVNEIHYEYFDTKYVKTLVTITPKY